MGLISGFLRIFEHYKGAICKFKGTTRLEGLFSVPGIRFRIMLALRFSSLGLAGRACGLVGGPTLFFR